MAFNASELSLYLNHISSNKRPLLVVMQLAVLWSSADLVCTTQAFLDQLSAALLEVVQSWLNSSSK